MSNTHIHCSMTTRFIQLGGNGVVLTTGCPQPMIKDRNRFNITFTKNDQRAGYLTIAMDSGLNIFQSHI